MLLFEKDFPEMAASRYEQNEDFFIKMFNEPDMMSQIMYTVGTVLYERLKKKAYTFDTADTFSMAAEDIAPYDEKK